MAIRHVAPHPHRPGMHIGGPLLLIGVLLVVGVAIAVVLRDQWAANQPAAQPALTVPAAPASVDQARDQWYRDQAAASVDQARDQWYRDQAAAPAPVGQARDRWWTER